MQYVYHPEALKQYVFLKIQACPNEGGPDDVLRKDIASKLVNLFYSLAIRCNTAEELYILGMKLLGSTSEESVKRAFFGNKAKNLSGKPLKLYRFLMLLHHAQKRNFDKLQHYYGELISEDTQNTQEFAEALARTVRRALVTLVYQIGSDLDRITDNNINMQHEPTVHWNRSFSRTQVAKRLPFSLPVKQLALIKEESDKENGLPIPHEVSNPSMLGANNKLSRSVMTQRAIPSDEAEQKFTLEGIACNPLTADSHQSDGMHDEDAIDASHLNPNI